MSMTTTTASAICQEKAYAAMPADGQGQEDLVRGVGDRGQRVAGEDRQRDPLGQQRLAEPVAAQGPAEQQPFGRLRHRGHVRECYGVRSSVSRRRAHSVSAGPRGRRRSRRLTRATDAEDERARRRSWAAGGSARTLANTWTSRATRSRSSTRTRRRSAGSAGDFGGRKVVGIGFDRDTLVEAGIEQAHAFAAVSSGDNSNILAARVARETFGDRQRRRPHLRPRPRRGLPAARHPDRRDACRWTGRPDAPPPAAR